MMGGSFLPLDSAGADLPGSSSCPCALVISIPLRLLVASAVPLNAASSSGQSHRLEALAQVTTGLLDKTGTLTQGSLRGHRHPPGDARTGALALVSAESYSDHPISQRSLGQGTGFRRFHSPKVDSSPATGNGTVGWRQRVVTCETATDGKALGVQAPEIV